MLAAMIAQALICRFMAVLFRRLLFSAFNSSRAQLALNYSVDALPKNIFFSYNTSSVIYRIASNMPKRAAAATKATEKKEEVAEKPKRPTRAKKAKEEVEKIEEQQEQPKKVTARVTKGKAKAAAPVKVKAAKKKAEAPADSAEQSAAKPKPKRQARKAVAKENNNVQEEKVEPKKRANKRAAVKQPQPEEEDEISEENAAEEPTGKRGRKAPAPAKPLNRTDTNYENVSFSCTRKNAKGEEYNLKISSWNVDGLRSWLKKGGTEFLEKEQPDVLCLQETKCSASKIPEELKDVKEYKTYWCDSKKDGYAGVAVLSKTEPLDVKYGIGEEGHDEEGRCITVEFEKFFLVNVYVPNAGRKLVTLPKRLDWNTAFKAYIKELDKKKPVILCGDMNVAHEEIDIANPKTNTKNAGFTKEEREGMTEFLADGYVDTFRKLYPERKDAYTFWSYMNNARAKNIGWRLDYFIVSDRFMDQVCDNQIRHEVYGSDHCPLTMFLHI